MNKNTDKIQRILETYSNSEFEYNEHNYFDFYKIIFNYLSKLHIFLTDKILSKS